MDKLVYEIVGRRRDKWVVFVNGEVLPTTFSSRTKTINKFLRTAYKLLRGRRHFKLIMEIFELEAKDEQS